MTCKVTQKFRFVACGGSHALAIGMDGLCYAWGANEARQLSLAVPGEFCPLPTAVKLPLSDPVPRIDHVACGFSSSALLLSDGSVFAAGTVVGQSPFKVRFFSLFLFFFFLIVFKSWQISISRKTLFEKFFALICTCRSQPLLAKPFCSTALPCRFPQKQIALLVCLATCQSET